MRLLFANTCILTQSIYYFCTF